MAAYYHFKPNSTKKCHCEDFNNTVMCMKFLPIIAKAW